MKKKSKLVSNLLTSSLIFWVVRSRREKERKRNNDGERTFLDREKEGRKKEKEEGRKKEKEEERRKKKEADKKREFS
eukprot:CAMPEP_0201479264 /NCGR_PEP_ID=MMETSP0151_2-20130828/3971_1 /ASSEMBLY_ACC=CAM_ASM_000257 /TAXON_ID=200890 /ORGANISM="Paramoeba atlantica, Strain 621/1 / CCAP 1560/9" /LENGTH=76 /DNA_ID=CAMNT_0047860661 /DNA_START=718 /DNA_END=945 /DNA_ORIENTATION=-